MGGWVGVGAIHRQRPHHSPQPDLLPAPPFSVPTLLPACRPAGLPACPLTAALPAPMSIYSYGVCLWELMTDQEPWQDHSPMQVRAQCTSCLLFLLHALLMMCAAVPGLRQLRRNTPQPAACRLPR